MPFLCITDWIRQLLASQTRVSVLKTTLPKGCPPSVCHCHLLSFQPWASNSGPQVISDLFVFPGIYHNTYHNHLKSDLWLLTANNSLHGLISWYREEPQAVLSPQMGFLGRGCQSTNHFTLGTEKLN